MSIWTGRRDSELSYFPFELPSTIMRLALKCIIIIIEKIWRKVSHLSNSRHSCQSPLLCARCRPLSSARPNSHWNWPYIFRESRCEKRFQNYCDDKVISLWNWTRQLFRSTLSRKWNVHFRFRVSRLNDQ